jgi:hypothetical protein
MSQRSVRRAVFGLLTLLALTFLSPTLATARPLQAEQAARPAAERAEAGFGFLAQVRGFLSLLWAANGSGLDPDGAHTTSGTTGDNGSGLDPNGRR